MVKARLGNVLRRHNVPWSQALLADLAYTMEELVEEAWLDQAQALELVPHLNGVGSLRQWLAKHRVRRRTSVSRTEDVLRAAALGDRRRRRET